MTAFYRCAAPGKQTYLPARMAAVRLLAGDDGAHGARLLGFDPTMKTVAVSADGADLVINGSKTWISNARKSGRTISALLCKTDPAARPQHRGISMVVQG